jgi:3,4-dihydroxy-2-butanone 4-phosphate synthase
MSYSKISPDSVERYMREASAMVCLPIAEEHVVGIKNYLQLSLRMMAALEPVPLSIDDDFAPIFRV